MKTKGKYIVHLYDGVQDDHFPNGDWIISRGNHIVAESVDQKEWSADLGPLRARLAAVRAGDELHAESFSGATGVKGTIIQRSGNYLLVQGEAWGSARAAFYDQKYLFETGTFDVSVVNAVYCGSLQEFLGLPVDRKLVHRIMERAHPEVLVKIN